MEIVLTLGILVIALTSFIFELLPVDTTAICVAVVLMIFGLVTPEEGIAGFGNSATITVMAMFILSAGITRTGVVQIARDGLTKWGGNNLTQQIIAMGVIVGPISGFINNTAVVAIFLPIIEDWCKKQRISVSKLLMPLSFVTILGGMITLIGTSTNILASGVSKKLGYGEFSIFQFTKLGILTFLIGLVYLAFIAPKLLPNRKPLATEFIGEDYDIKDYLSELIIKPRSSLVGQTLSRSEIQRKFDLDVLEIVQNGMRFSQPLGDKVLGVGDILIVRSGKDSFQRRRESSGRDT